MNVSKEYDENVKHSLMMFTNLVDRFAFNEYKQDWQTEKKQRQNRVFAAKIDEGKKRSVNSVVNGR